MKKLMFICQSLGNGGAERVVSVLSNCLKNRYTVFVLAMAGKDKTYHVDDSVIVLSPSGMIRKGAMGKYQRIMTIREAIRENDIDTVIAFSHYNAMYSVIAGTGLKVKIIGSERNDPAQLDDRRFLCWLRLALYRKLDALVCQTEDAMGYFPIEIQKKACIIMNPLSQNLPAPYHGEREKRFVSFLRLEPQKNIPMLIDAFYRLHLDYPEYCLEIYGEGSEKDSIQKRITELRADPYIKIFPFEKDIHKRVLHATAFVLPSNYEGLSNSMLESMAIGLPVIVTDCPCGGARMAIENKKNGYLVPVGDTEELYRSMCHVIKSPDEARFVSENASFIRDKLSAPVIADQWMKIIDG